MDIPKLSDISPNAATRTQAGSDLMAQLIKLGAIEARVSSLAKGQVLLNSQLGQITGLNTLNLKPGDRIQIRLDDSGHTPVLKVSQLPARPIAINAASAKSLSKSLTIGRPVTAVIVSQTTESSLLRIANQPIGNQQITIPRQPGLNAGQLISLLKPASGSQIEIRPINHQQVLKSALSRLLPTQTDPAQPSAVTQLVKLIHSITRSVSEMQSLQQQSNLSSNTKPDNMLISSPLLNQFKALLATLPQLPSLTKTTIQEWIRLVMTNKKNDSSSTQSSPYQILRQISKSEASVARLLQQAIPVIQSQSHQSIDSEARPNIDDPLQTMARDIIKLVEQSINQQLLQQTSTRYQQELQQPFAINLAIPITDNDRTRELKLKIRQNSRESDEDRQSWDIHLDFEFGLLGLISTHLLLEENTLSASFWSILPATQNKIDDNLTDFKQQISRAGFNIGEFNSFPGKPPEELVKEVLPRSESLLDIKV